ncbi:MAG: ABC transporter ATP-binding protein [Deltaproteobacteria bacterium]|nr:ABC transporter ATP-binding protein [Deltaproteobacteria bacterium]
MTAAVVQVRALCKTYGAKVALDAVDLQVERGAVFGLLGPNGAGKSTTFGVLTGWLGADAGVATVLDVPCRHLYRLAGKVGAMPQDAAFPRMMPVEETLVHLARLGGCSAAASRTEAARVLELVGLGDVARSRGFELSHGMLKRVALAQALLGAPELVFLDEPTAGLDPAAAKRVKDIVRALAPRTTVVISSHNLAEIQEVCTHGAILDHGRLVTAGSIETLTRRGAEVRLEVREGLPLPTAALEAAVPGAKLRVERGVIEVSFPSTTDPAEIIAALLRVLLEHRVPILGVQRGKSLESAFLEATKR